MVMEGRYYYSLVPWLLCGGEKKEWYTQSAQWKLKSSETMPCLSSYHPLLY